MGIDDVAVEYEAARRAILRAELSYNERERQLFELMRKYTVAVPRGFRRLRKPNPTEPSAPAS